MQTDKNANDFLSQYDEQIFSHAEKLRELLFANLPGITGQVDIAAKMIAYRRSQGCQPWA